jgi:17beta-estradiol 17-dehydrogenase / very-long-chain 3-oxoacyl-CoA reductase
VTGATDGIGKALAKKLAAQNMNLILHGRNSHKLENLREEIKGINNKIKVNIVLRDLSEECRDALNILAHTQ